MAPPPERFDPVIIYDPKDGGPEWPADAPPGAVLFFLPSNGRDRFEVLEGEDETEALGATKPTTTEPTIEDQPRWRDEIL